MQQYDGTTIVSVRKTIARWRRRSGFSGKYHNENAKKVRLLYRDQVLAGFAGGMADAFTLFEKFEEQLEKHNGKLLDLRLN